MRILLFALYAVLAICFAMEASGLSRVIGVRAQETDSPGLPRTVNRFIDEEAGVVCYMRTSSAGGIDCLLIQETWLRE